MLIVPVPACLYPRACTRSMSSADHLACCLPSVLPLQARIRTPEVERYLRSLDDSTRGAVLRDLEGTLRGLYSQVLRTFGL